jgi:hypothetical protein
MVKVFISPTLMPAEVAVAAKVSQYRAKRIKEKRR